MVDTLIVYPNVLRSSDGTEHMARACGRERDDERWEGWLELDPIHGGATLRTPRETTQHDRAALVAWAQGLSHVYLEGVFERAVPGTPEGRPAHAPTRARTVAAPAAVVPEGVLDPFEVYADGQDFLRRCLEGLSVSHLRHIAQAQRMLDREMADELTKEELIDLIERETRSRAAAEELHRAGEGSAP